MSRSKGVGAMVGRSAALGLRFYDGLAKVASTDSEKAGFKMAICSTVYRCDFITGAKNVRAIFSHFA